MLEKILKVKQIREQRIQRKITQINRQIQQIAVTQETLTKERIQLETELKALQQIQGVMTRKDFQKFRVALHTCFQHLRNISEKKSILAAEKENLQQALSDEQLNLKENITSQEKLKSGMQQEDDNKS